MTDRDWCGGGGSPLMSAGKQPPIPELLPEIKMFVRNNLMLVNMHITDHTFLVS
jgi:hypothetical protein